MLLFGDAMCIQPFADADLRLDGCEGSADEGENAERFFGDETCERSVAA